MVYMMKEVYDSIIKHAKEHYPNECCGVLVGTIEGNKRIERAYRTENINKERTRDRYEIDPGELLRIEKEAKREGQTILGIYHSHPDHPSSPSEFDRKRGWSGYSYVIISVDSEGRTEVRSWTFDEDDEPFREERIAVV